MSEDYNIKSKFKQYLNIDKAKEWLENNLDKVKAIFQNIKLRNYIFEPFKQVFSMDGDSSSAKIKSVISIVAISNMVMAGLPGKMGVGVTVSMALEGWMAYVIARNVGIKLRQPSDVWKYFGMVAGTSVIILQIFRHLLGFAFSLFSVIPFISPMILAELFVTDFVGVLFWVGFEEARDKGSFKVPKRAFLRIKDRTKDIYTFQKNALKDTLTLENLKKVGKRLKAWLTGEIDYDKPALKGEILPLASMIYLIQGKYESLSGPLGEVFITSIRRAYSTKLGNASLDEMRDFFSGRNPEQLKGDVSLVKGEMREHLGEQIENADGDNTSAELHESRTVPGSDAVFTNIETGERIRVSYKTVSDPQLIEDALEKYPQYPIVANEEMREYFGDHPMVMFDGIENQDMKTITEDNFEKLAGSLESFQTMEVAVGSVGAKVIASLWPFVIAYIRKRISREQLDRVFTTVLGDSGATLLSRISWAIVLGPVFAWYLLARSIILITKGSKPVIKEKHIVLK